MYDSISKMAKVESSVSKLSQEQYFFVFVVSKHKTEITAVAVENVLRKNIHAVAWYSNYNTNGHQQKENTLRILVCVGKVIQRGQRKKWCPHKSCDWPRNWIPQSPKWEASCRLKWNIYDGILLCNIRTITSFVLNRHLNRHFQWTRVLQKCKHKLKKWK